VAALYFLIACLSQPHCIVFVVSGVQVYLIWRYCLSAGTVADYLKLLLYCEWIVSESEYTMHRLAFKNGENGCCCLVCFRKFHVFSWVSVIDCSRLNNGGLCCRCFLRYAVMVSQEIWICSRLLLKCVCSRISQLFVSVALQKSAHDCGFG
jgi:hypothetical protein